MKALVTGGGGFLGRYVVRKLIAEGYQVRSISRGKYPILEEMGVECMQGDLQDVAATQEAVSGVDIVFHVAASADMWGSFEKFYTANVQTTLNIIDACKKLGVNKLVYTSSPSVVFPMGDLCGVDESQPYPQEYSANYPHTKAIAEKAVLAANGPDLATTSLRPHLIWGPEDTHIVPLLAERSKTGKLIQIGDGKNLVHLCYVTNAADAHFLAGKSLGPGSKNAGKAYFITDKHEVNLWDWVNHLLTELKLPTVSKSISYKKALFLAGIIETAYKLLPLKGAPRITKFMASNFATSHYFDISASERDFNYIPQVSNEKGLANTIEWYNENF